MKVDFIIVGQGICGTWLSYYLSKTRASFVVIDNNKINSSSRTAAGIINPVTGRRVVKTWIIETLLSHLKIASVELERELGIPVLSQKNTIDFFPTQQSKSAFEERLKSEQHFLKHCNDQDKFHSLFQYEFGYGEINPCFLFNLQEVLPAWRNKLVASNRLVEEDFDIRNLSSNTKGVSYKNISAGKIIFCDGIASMQNPYFKHLPFSFNKGEALLIESAEIPTTTIYKKGIVLAPQKDNLFWVGSNYEWNFKDENPTKEFLDKTKKQLQDWLKVPFKIVDHKASIRPANLERRPFVGFLPNKKNIGILNGMGTKGCSLAPFFAKQFADFLFHNSTIHAEADVARFKKPLE